MSENKIGVVSLPSALPALRAAGYEVVTGDDFGAAASKIRRELQTGGTFPVLVGDNSDTHAGAMSWLRATAAKTAVVVIASPEGRGLNDPAVRAVHNTPVSLGDVLLDAEEPMPADDLFTAVIEPDGTLTAAATTAEPASEPAPEQPQQSVDTAGAGEEEEDPWASSSVIPGVTAAEPQTSPAPGSTPAPEADDEEDPWASSSVIPGVSASEPAPAPEVEAETFTEEEDVPLAVSAPVATPEPFEEEEDDDEEDFDFDEDSPSSEPRSQAPAPQLAPEPVEADPQPLVVPEPVAPAPVAPAAQEVAFEPEPEPAPVHTAPEPEPAYEVPPAVPAPVVSEPAGALDDLADLLAEGASDYAPTSQATVARRGKVIVVMSAKGGVGKALPLGAAIPTPSGWTTMGDLQAGSTVLGRDGRPTTVTEVFDHEDLEFYDVHLSDGQVIRACADHRWLVSGYYARLNRSHPDRVKAIAAWDSNAAAADAVREVAEKYEDGDELDVVGLMQAVSGIDGIGWNTPASFHGAARHLARQAGGRRNVYPAREALLAIAETIRARKAPQRPELGVRERVLTTAQMLAEGVKVHPGGKPNSNFAIRLTEPLDLPDVDLPVAPYTLGVWLGDGTSTSSGCCIPDPEVLEHVVADGYEVTQTESQAKRWSHTIRGLRTTLGQLGVLGDKHIPLPYLRASKAQRLALLQGLMDTDGTVNATGRCEFVVTSERLARDVLELVRSLGMKAHFSSGAAALTEDDPENPGQTRRREVGTRFRVGFTPNTQVFRLPRKAQRVQEAYRVTQDWLYITDITPAGRGPGRCITVAADDHVFLAAQFVPTHNSSTALNIAQYAAEHGPEGLRVCVVDANRGQGDLRTYLRIPSAPIPTVYDAARTREPSAAFSTPNTLAQYRDERWGRIGFALVPAPPADLADPHVVTAEVYRQVIEHARTVADIVIVDTQIFEAVDTTNLWDKVMVPLMANDAWSLAISDTSPPGVRNLVERLSTFAGRGVDKGRVMIALNKVAEADRETAAALGERLRTQGRYLGSIAMDPRIDAESKLGRLSHNNEHFAPVLAAALHSVTGLSEFDPARLVVEEKPSFMSRLLGRKKKAAS